MPEELAVDRPSIERQTLRVSVSWSYEKVGTGRGGNATNDHRISSIRATIREIYYDIVGLSRWTRDIKWCEMCTSNLLARKLIHRCRDDDVAHPRQFSQLQVGT